MVWEPELGSYREYRCWILKYGISVKHAFQDECSLMSATEGKADIDLGGDGSNLGHHIDGVVFPYVLRNRKPDLVARLGNFHHFVVDLHRFDFLFEV